MRTSPRTMQLLLASVVAMALIGSSSSLVATTPADSAEEGTVRLVGGASSSEEGEVQIFYRDGWGAVCIDHQPEDVRVDERGGLSGEATVVCRQLGFNLTDQAEEGTPGDAFDGADSLLTLAAVLLISCNGTEARVTDCLHRVVEVQPAQTCGDLGMLPLVVTCVGSSGTRIPPLYSDSLLGLSVGAIMIVIVLIGCCCGCFCCLQDRRRRGGDSDSDDDYEKDSKPCHQRSSVPLTAAFTPLETTRTTDESPAVVSSGPGEVESPDRLVSYHSSPRGARSSSQFTTPGDIPVTLSGAAEGGLPDDLVRYHSPLGGAPSPSTSTPLDNPQLPNQR